MTLDRLSLGQIRWLAVAAVLGGLLWIPYGVFEMLKPWAASVLEMLFDVQDLPLVNVNFPAKPPRGMLWTCQSLRHYDGKVVPAKDPMGRQIYWYTVVPVESTEETSDRWAFDNGYVSITPLRG